MSRLLWMRARRLDVWRLKVYELEEAASVLAYRVIYAYDAKKWIFYIISYRSVDYERNPEFARRVQQAYKDLGIAEM